jgi:hypothetical protein
MSENRSAAATLYPDLPSAASQPSAPPPDPDRSAAQSVYGTPEGGIAVAREVTAGGVAKPASETTEPNSGGTEREVAPTRFDPAKFEGADPALIGDFGKLASKAGISHETASELMTLHNNTSARYWDSQQTQWETAVKADPEIGGDKLENVVTTVKDFLSDRDIVDPEVVNLLSTYRLGSHPAVIRTLYRIAKLL